MKNALEFVILCINRWLKIEVPARQKKRISIASPTDARHSIYAEILLVRKLIYKLRYYAGSDWLDYRVRWEYIKRCVCASLPQRLFSTLVVSQRDSRPSNFPRV